MPIRNVKDNSFKLILGDHYFFAEFLKDFIPIDLFKDILPDDIEDLTERFLPLFQDNKDSDTIKKVNLKDQTPLFVIAIVEHESDVNFRSSFKMLQYICLVLDAWEKEINKEHPGASSQKDFKYPPVLPVIFYDGKDAWTAERNFRNRTALSEVFGKYIPTFEYELVDLKTFSAQEILRFNDIFSLVLLIDRIGTMEGGNFLEQLPEDYLERLRLKIPENLTKLLGDVVRVLLARFNAPEEEVEAIVERIDHKEAVTMFDALVERYQKRWEEGVEIGRQEGVEIEAARAQEKALQEKLEMARKLKAMGVPVKKIADASGLSPEQIKEL
jgi:predicted transposase/invertase (TIGR01784 family)